MRGAKNSITLETQFDISDFQGAILEAVATGNDFATIAELICQGAERLTGDTVCTILGIDVDGLMHPVSAPSLPESYSQALDGVEIGPNKGSCGTAAHYGEPVLTEDIETDPKWDGYRELVLPLG